MNKFLGRFRKMTDIPSQISKNVVIESDNPYIHGLIKKYASGEDGIEKISYVQGVPKELISESFGNVYSESEEAYAVVISDEITVYSNSIRGNIYGTVALIRECENGLTRGIVYNYPRCEFRGVSLMLPGVKNIDFTKKLLEYCAYYAVNTVLFEVGGAMEYKRHPEINEGWELLCENVGEYQGKAFDIVCSREWNKNVFHIENGGMSYLKQEQVKEIVRYAKELDIEIIPIIPSLSHSDYILYNHRELAERPEDDYPDTYCPLNDKVYDILFDIIDEVADVFEPETINIGHDEWYSPCVCEKCRNKKAEELFAQDIRKIYDYIKKKGIDVMMYGDKLINAYTMQGRPEGGALKPVRNFKTGLYQNSIIPATYKAIDLIPEDIKIYHWYHGIDRRLEKEFLNRNRYMIFGNFCPANFKYLQSRLAQGAKGICSAVWSMTDAIHIQRNDFYADTALSNILVWGKDTDGEEDFAENFRAAVADVYNYKNRNTGRRLEVTHTCMKRIKHMGHVDGILMDMERDYLGRYVIEYTDGTKTEKAIYYALHIGFAEQSFERIPADDRDAYQTTVFLCEPAGSCDFELCNNVMYYKYSIPLERDKYIKSVKFIAREDFEKDIMIKSWEVIE